MSLELINTLASMGTFVVIGASAIAAVIQLRHVGASNQIALLMKLHDTIQSAEFIEARRFIATDLGAIVQDDANHAMLRRLPLKGGMEGLGMVGNFFENAGLLVRHRMLNEAMICELWAGLIVQTWQHVAPALAFVREGPDGSDIWENFEYLTVISEDWVARHPGGDYPKGYRRLTLPPITTRKEVPGPLDTDRAVSAPFND